MARSLHKAPLPYVENKPTKKRKGWVRQMGGSMTDYKLTPEQEQRFDEWNWRSDSSVGKIKSSTDIRELKILLAQEIQRAVEAEQSKNIKTLETVLMLLNGDDNQVQVLKNYCKNKLEALTKIETTEEKK